MGAKLGTKGAVADLNLTPLIDIVLVVLIIMMVSMPVEIEHMGVKLPGQVQVQTKSDVPVEQLVIAVYDDERLGLNRTVMTEEQLFHKVSRHLRGLEKKNVFIDAHPDVPYPRVVAMMDLARTAGADKIGLARMKDEGPLPPLQVEAGSAPKGVLLGNPAVVGALTASKADEVFSPLLGSVEKCYDQGLAANPTLTGRVLVRITVGPDGAQMGAEIASSTLGSEAVETCVAELLPAVAFPALGEGNTAVVQYPILFSPG